MPEASVSFKPANEKQRRFLNSTRKFIMYSGAVGAGKSYVGLAKGLLLNLIYPGNVGLVCRKEAASMQNSTLRSLFEKILPPELIVYRNDQKGVVVHKTPQPGVYSRIVWSGLDKKASQQYPTKIGSTEYGWVFLDEGVEVDEGDWMMLGTRLRHTIPGLSAEANAKIPRQLFTATNPDVPWHFLHRFFIEQQDLDDREVIFTTPYENPFLPPDYIPNLESGLTGVFRDRLLLGKWIAAEGMIYTDFDPEKHVSSDLLPLSDYKDLIGGADSNYPIPRAGLLIGIRGDGSVDVLDEFYRESAQPEDLAAWFSEYATSVDRYVTVYHDPSDPSAIDKLNNEAHITAIKADNKVVPGIGEVARYFAQDKIRIHPQCQNLISELQSYRWKHERTGEQPEKTHDHAVDALRYALATMMHYSGEYTLIDLSDVL